MSTKAHFIYEPFLEGFEETSEPRSIFGKFKGYDSYLIIENGALKNFCMQGDYLIIETKECKLPNKFRIWGDAILEFDYDMECLCISLKGGHHVTRKIISNNYTDLIII
jgi:hypothetical protein